METLMVVAQRDQFHSRRRGRDHGSYPSREYNCRTSTFQSGSGILPIPLKSRSPPKTKQSSLDSPKTKTPSVTPSVVKKHVHSDQNPRQKWVPKSSSVTSTIDAKHIDDSIKDNTGGSFNGNFLHSEPWAGPAYSNSPPPSALPMPTFLIKPKRSASFNLPSASASDINFLTPFAKSAPPSPTRDHHKSTRKDFCNGHDEFATKILRRILNLDMVDE